jgi:hypothetical protein
MGEGKGQNEKAEENASSWGSLKHFFLLNLGLG